MGLRVGTIFTRCESDNEGNLDFPCLVDEGVKLDECIGIIQYFGHSDITVGRVLWVQSCRNHPNPSPWLDWFPIDQMWEIGQIS